METLSELNEKGQKEKIRLIGIDTPEVRRTGRTEVEYFGKEASEYVKIFLPGRRLGCNLICSDTIDLREPWYKFISMTGAF